MPRRKLSDAERWQAIGMIQTGMTYRRVGEYLNVSHSVIVRLVQHWRRTGGVEESKRTGRPRKTTEREDRLLKRLARQSPFDTANTLRSRWNTQTRISRSTVNRRLNKDRLRSRRPMKRPLLSQRHKRARLLLARQHRRWNIRSWKQVHCSDESQFLLHPVDGRVPVWRHPNCAYKQQHVLGTKAFGGGGVTVWGCFSLQCTGSSHSR
jgi:transposase